MLMGSKKCIQTLNGNISCNINVMDLGVYSFPPSMILEIIPLMLERVDVNFLLNIKRVRTKIFSQKILLQCGVTFKVVQWFLLFYFNKRFYLLFQRFINLYLFKVSYICKMIHIELPNDINKRQIRPWRSMKF